MSQEDPPVLLCLVMPDATTAGNRVPLSCNEQHQAILLSLRPSSAAQTMMKGAAGAAKRETWMNVSSSLLILHLLLEERRCTPLLLPSSSFLLIVMGKHHRLPGKCTPLPPLVNLRLTPDFRSFPVSKTTSSRRNSLFPSPHAHPALHSIPFAFHTKSSSRTTSFPCSP